MKSVVFRLSIGITRVLLCRLVSFGSTWNMTQARDTRCDQGMSCHFLCHALWSRQISWPSKRLLASRNDFLSVTPHLPSCLNPIYPFIHVWRYSPFWALTSLKRLLLSSLSSPHLLHSLIPKTWNASGQRPSLLFFLFSYWFVLLNFPLRTSFEILLHFSWCNVPPMFVGFPQTWG